MGIFDAAFSNPETLGLLSAAAQGLQMSGPSRTPVSTGQVIAAMLGGGAQGYQSAQQAQADNALRALKMKQLGMGLEKDDMEMRQLRDAMARQERIRSRIAQAPVADQAQAPAVAASFAPAGQMSPKVGGPDWMQNYQAQQPSMPSAPMRSPANASRAFADNLIAKAKIYGEEGDDATALKMYEQATKFMPKVKNWQEVEQGGKVMYAPYFEDGTAGQPVPYEVAKKLEFRNTGRTTDAINPFTGQVVSSIKNTMSPDAAASNALGWANNKLAGERLAMDRTAPKGQIVQTENGPILVDPRNPNSAQPIMMNGEQVRGSGRAPTEFQGKSATFGARAQAADKILSDLGTKYSPTAINAKQGLGKMWGVGGALEAGANLMLGPESQMAEQAQRDFVNAVLRQESGAAISESEFNNAKKQYFPQPGDSDAVISQKAANRQLAIRGFLNNAGRAALPEQPSSGASGDWSIQRVD